jgi:hypothetical protein
MLRWWQLMLELWRWIMGNSPKVHRIGLVTQAQELVGDFDATALFGALDRQRLERALSWRQAADAIWVPSSELDDLRKDHPIVGWTARPKFICEARW